MHDSGRTPMRVLLSLLVALLGALLIAGPAAAADFACSGGGTYTVDGAHTITSSTDCTGGIVIPADVTAIGASAFYGRTGLTSVGFAAGSRLTAIGDGAFYGTTGLTGITIPASVTTIGANAFWGATGLTSVTFASPSSLTTIGNSAFRNTSGLTGITIPASVTLIDRNAFRGATSLARVAFITPSHLATIDNYAFYGATALTGVNVPSGVATIGASAFRNTTRLATVAIPASVSTIGEQAFANAPQLTSFAIGEPSGLTTISFQMLYGATRLPSITIPAGVTGIGDEAFAGATALARIAFLGAAPTVGVDAFYGVDASATAYRLAPATDFGAGPTWQGLPLDYWLPAPDAPVARAGDATATITIGAAPALGPAPTSYTIAAVSHPEKTCTITGATGSCTITGLANGTAYAFTATSHTTSPELASDPSPASGSVTPNHATVSIARASATKRAITTRVSANVPGALALRATARLGTGSHAPVVEICETTKTVPSAIATAVTCTLTRRARAALARHALQATLTAVLTATDTAYGSATATAKLTLRS